jgi:4'-phosphopantetheinyl transferase
MDVSIFSEKEYEDAMQQISEKMQQKIQRYRQEVDRRLKLFARLLVRDFHKQMGRTFDWSQWKCDASNKPYIENGFKFNISHSANRVVVAFSTEEIGIDIEENKEHTELDDILSYFHIDEQKLIKASDNLHETFLKAWTRKEAYLKASGEGIVNGLADQNCMQDVVQLFNQSYQLETTQEIDGYIISICAPINHQLNIEEQRFLDRIQWV